MLGEIVFNSFMKEAPYDVETSPLISSANQWSAFYMIGNSVIKELNAIVNIHRLK